MFKSEFSALLSQYDFPQSFIYLAPVLPLVQVMWADGRNQMPERAKIHVIIQDHCNALNELAGGVNVVSSADVETFDRVFIANQPPAPMLQTFTEYAKKLLEEKAGEAVSQAGSLYNQEKLFHACLEIAATSPVKIQQDFGEDVYERVIDQERSFIRQLFNLVDEAK